jgi:uncharacterized membrane protein YdjX (TVP38/TMEM64 family)
MRLPAVGQNSRRKALAAAATVRHAWGRLGPVAPIAAGAALLPLLGGLAIYGRLGAIAGWLRTGWASSAPLLCVALFSLTGGLAILPTYAISVLCGWSFGFTIGLAATLCSFFGAAIVGYAFTAAADRGRALTVVEEQPKWSAIRRAVATGRPAKLTAVVTLVRLAPVTPFSFTSIVMAALRVPVLPYVVGTMLGMAPRAVLVTYFASQMGEAAKPGGCGGGAWFWSTALAATVACVWGFAWVGRRGLRRLAVTT